MLRILAERNRPHGQMLGEEAQEALQGKKRGVPTRDDLCGIVAVPPPVREVPGTRLFLIAPVFFPEELENTCPLPATSTFSLASLLNYRNIWKNLLILGFTK